MGKLNKFNLLAESLRLREIFLMTGFSFVGILYTNVNEWINLSKNITVYFFVLFYVMAVYFLNSLAGYKQDIQSERLNIIGSLRKSSYAWLFIVFSCLFAALGLYINATVFVFSIVALFLWIIYYLPPFKFKSTFLLGTFIHLIAGVLHFHTGYCSFNGFNKNSIIISVFFALLLCIGHFHHEIIDYEADKNSGNRTTAVRIGLSRMFILRTFLVGIAVIYYTIIYWESYIGKVEYFLFIAPTMILFILSATLKANSVLIFQKISRSLYLLAGLVLFFLKIIEFAKFSLY